MNLSSRQRVAWNVLGCVAVLSIVSLTAVAEPLAPPAETGADLDSPAAPSKEDAPRLTAEAIHAQLVGKLEERDALLEQAITADPDFAPARWQRGEVQFDRKWRSLEAIQEQVAANPRYQEYARIRSQMAGTLADHEELARWCYREGLENEERAHWRYVLSVNPEHQFARTRLGVRPYANGLYSEEQIAAHERHLRAVKENLEKLKPVFAALCRRVSHGEGTDRALALVELRQIAEIASIPALEDAVQREARSAPDDVDLDLYLAVVESLAGIDDPQATHRLLQYAVFAERPEVRRHAASALKDRPVTDYVPQLLGTLASPIESEVNAVRTADGSLMYDENYFQAGPLSDYVASRTEVRKLPQTNGRFGPNAGRRYFAIRNNQLERASAARRQVEIANAQIESRNLRVREVLANVFGGDLGNDPRAYWQAWTDFNELYVPDRETITLADEYSYQYIPTMSCFAPGTLVWTQAGPRAIETIAVGDMALSQNPSTGELAFRPVIETTIRPPSRMVRIETGGSTVEATLGHRIWINGKGWEMAKFISPASALQAVDGVALVDRVEPLEPAERTEAYNLVVDEFHTYFVGEARLLVHDNTCPQPTASKSPGQVKLAELAATTTATP